MKKFMKKVNRGVLLGVAVSLVFIVYIIVDIVKFNEQKPEIRQTLEAYFEEFTECLNVQEGETDDKGVITDKARSEKKEALLKLIDNYWGSKVQTQYTDEMYIEDIPTKTSLKKDIEELFDDKSKSLNYTEFTAEADNVVIKKYGANAAKIELDINVVYKITGYSNPVSPIDVSYVEELFWGGDISNDMLKEFENVDKSDKENEIKFADKLNDTVFSVNNQMMYMEVYMVKEDGEWKISSTSPTWGGSMITVEEDKFEYSNQENSAGESDKGEMSDSDGKSEEGLDEGEVSE